MKSVRISFKVPCVVRGRYGRGKVPKPMVVMADLEHEVPCIDHNDTVLAYGVRYPRKSDGYAQIACRDGVFYTGTSIYDNASRDNGWPEEPWQVETPLYARLWNSVLLELMAGRKDNYSVGMIVGAVTAKGDDTGDAWHWVQATAAGMKPYEHTETDLEGALERARRVLDDLVIYRREIHIRTGQPCYEVRVEGARAKISVGNTEVHSKVRQAAFSHPSVYPWDHSEQHAEIGKHYFPAEDVEGMLEFIARTGAKLPSDYRRIARHQWADHAPHFDGLELDRVARVFLYEVSKSFSVLNGEAFISPLLKFHREFFDAILDVRDFLEERHDPETSGDQLATKLFRLVSACESPGPDVPRLMGERLETFVRQGIARFEDRPIGCDFLSNAGPLPSRP